MNHYLEHIKAVREVCAACQYSKFSGGVPHGKIWMCQNKTGTSNLAIIHGVGIPIHCIMTAEHALKSGANEEEP